jgi:hypothetical protein
MRRVRLLLTWCILACMFSLLGYGLVRFPDAPIHPCPSGYCGKQGQLRALEDYQGFHFWERALMLGWPIGICLLVILNKGEMLKRMGRKP